MQKANAVPSSISDLRSGSRAEWIELALLILFILALPMLVGRGSLPKRSFDPTQARLLEESNPDVAFVGDSMLGTRIDPEALKSEAAPRCEVLAYSGSGSGVWYLLLKNYIAKMQHPPACVVFFFRGSQLTFVHFRLDGRYRHRLETLEKEAEPEFERIVAATDHLPLQRVDRMLKAVYPIQSFQETLQDKVQHVALHVVTRNKDAGAVRDATQSMFDLQNLRNTSARNDDGGGIFDFPAQPFEEQARNSFLPAMIRMAREAKIRLVFFRVKSRPLADGTPAIEKPAETKYQSELKAYLASEGAILIDETKETDITEDYYGEGDHVAPEKKSGYTALFWQKYGTVFGKGSVASGSR